MDSILEYLMNYALDNGIGIQLSSEFKSTTPAGCNTQTKMVVVNTNWHNQQQVPFTMAHEIAHIINGDVQNTPLYFSTAVSKSSIEYEANKTACKILIPIYLEKMEEHGISILHFMDIFQIPAHLTDMVSNVFEEYGYQEWKRIL